MLQPHGNAITHHWTPTDALGGKAGHESIRVRKEADPNSERGTMLKAASRHFAEGITAAAVLI